jgi:hypothetical protein
MHGRHAPAKNRAMPSNPSSISPSDAGARVESLRRRQGRRHRGLPLVVVLASAVIASIAMLAIHT